MDQIRRKLLISASALPLGLGLSACGGGDNGTDNTAAAAAGGRAQAQTVGANSPKIDISNPLGSMFNVDPVFSASARLKYFQPDPDLIQVVKNGSVYFVNISEVVVVGTTTYSRGISLALQSGSNGTYSLATNTGNKGAIYASVLTAGNRVPTHYEHTFDGNSVTLSVLLDTVPAGAPQTGTARLTFNGMRGAPTVSQTIGSTTVNLDAGTNAASLYVALNNSASVAVKYLEQNVPSI